MRLGSKKLTGFILILFFALGVLCFTVAAPGQALASVSGCSQNSRPMEMTGCEHPHYLCGFDTSSNLLSEGTFSSARFKDTFKNALGLVVGEACQLASNEGPAFIGKEGDLAFPVGPHKVSIRLFNSILNL